jgi:hypothetical protein
MESKIFASKKMSIFIALVFYTYKSLTIASFTLTGVKALSSQCFADPFEKGECEEKLVRWSFNEQWGSCTPFVYGGCGGNDNNFADKLECAAGWSGIFKLSRS